MADEKYVIKDMAVAREFLEPFKWDYIAVENATLGHSADLLGACLNSDDFWINLEKNHKHLKDKYPVSNPVNAKR